MLLNQNTVCTIDFIATNSTSLPKQWVASISWSTSEIKIDNVLSKYFQSRRIQVFQSTIRQEAGKSARGDTFDELCSFESLLDPRQTSTLKQRTESSEHVT